MLRICRYCQSPFRPHPKVPIQKYCSSETCQKARRRKWQKQKMQSDEDYKKNQREALSAWRKNNLGYWRRYRTNHPAYVEKNRMLQKKRNAKIRQRSKRQGGRVDRIAKMDELEQRNALGSGYYMLYPVALGQIAKMDEMLVKIDVISKA